MVLLGGEGLNKVWEGGQRTPGFFHSKGFSPSEFRQQKGKGYEEEKCQVHGMCAPASPFISLRKDFIFISK